MEWKIVLSQRANTEFIESTDWHDEHSDYISKKFENAILESIRLICDNPVSF